MTGPNTSTERNFVVDIDRRPVHIINAFGGNWGQSCYPDEDFYGQPCWFRGPDAIQNLIDRIEDLYESGWRRVWVNRPMGAPEGNYLVPSMCWETITEEKQEGVQTILKDYLATRPLLSFGIYIGYRLPSNCSEWLMLNTRLPNYIDREDIQQFHCNINEWIKAGIKEIHFDASAATNNKASYPALVRLLWSQGILSAGEAFPKIDVTLPNGQEGRLPDPEYTELVPWLFLEQHFNQGGPNERSWPYWEVDPEKTMMHVCFQGKANQITNQDTPQARAHIDDWVARGFIPCSWNSNSWFNDYILSTYAASLASTEGPSFGRGRFIAGDAIIESGGSVGGSTTGSSPGGSVGGAAGEGDGGSTLKTGFGQVQVGEQQTQSP